MAEMTEWLEAGSAITVSLEGSVNKKAVCLTEGAWLDEVLQRVANENSRAVIGYAIVRYGMRVEPEMTEEEKKEEVQDQQPQSRPAGWEWPTPAYDFFATLPPRPEVRLQWTDPMKGLLNGCAFSDYYQKQAARTLLPEPGFDMTMMDAITVGAALNVSSAAGMVAELIKKGIFHQHGIPTNIYGWLGSVQTGTDRLEEMVRGREHDPASNDIPTTIPAATIMRLWNAIGLAGEVGEVVQLIYSEALMVEDEGKVADKLEDELGDLLWYIAGLATQHGLKLSDIMNRNIQKLRRRYPDGFTSADSMARRDVADEDGDVI